MHNGDPSRDDSGPKPKGLLLVGVLQLLLAIVGAVTIATLATPNVGANIGLAMALSSIVLAAAAVGMAAYGRRSVGASQAGSVLQVATILVMALTGTLLLLVGWGIAEELV